MHEHATNPVSDTPSSLPPCGTNLGARMRSVSSCVSPPVSPPVSNGVHCNGQKPSNGHPVRMPSPLTASNASVALPVPCAA
eukprot:1276727-Prymnesium_polylepis.1